ncbi:hypothetical protein J4435_02810 [Candidatus Woesearchaeota archaeon]|nr:hypothetical protein [Candidatus Woesearchaeota archaeon]
MSFFGEKLDWFRRFLAKSAENSVFGEQQFFGNRQTVELQYKHFGTLMGMLKSGVSKKTTKHTPTGDGGDYGVFGEYGAAARGSNAERERR